MCRLKSEMQVLCPICFELILHHIFQAHFNGQKATMFSMKFFKYQGTGNDFIMVDQRERIWLTRADQPRIEKLCDRRFGIGGDGLILLQNHPEFDFEMIYFNADGRESSMCGNGGRCIAAFAQNLRIVENKARFLAIDGPHEAVMRPSFDIKTYEASTSMWVELKMSDVQTIENQADSAILNTGSPHFVLFKKSLDGLDVFSEGKKIRYSEPFKKEGINVNFVEKTGPTSLRVLTYERGVEAETLSCGTGVTAAALAFVSKEKWIEKGIWEIKIQTKGGDLVVKMELDGKGGFQNIWLCGPAKEVFSGIIYD